MLNKMMLIGNVVADPEVRYTPNGTAVCDLRIGSSYKYGKKDEEGNQQERKLYLTATVWGKRAENCNAYLKKGSGILVTGPLHTEQWEDANGAKKSMIRMTAEDIQFITRTKEGTSQEEE